eukprot:jgi/Chlat1/2366/Chrsp17S02813
MSEMTFQKPTKARKSICFLEKMLEAVLTAELSGNNFRGKVATRGWLLGSVLVGLCELVAVELQAAENCMELG